MAINAIDLEKSWSEELKGFSGSVGMAATHLLSVVASHVSLLDLSSSGSLGGRVTILGKARSTADSISDANNIFPWLPNALALMTVSQFATMSAHRLLPDPAGVQRLVDLPYEVVLNEDRVDEAGHELNDIHWSLDPFSLFVLILTLATLSNRFSNHLVHINSGTLSSFTYPILCFAFPHFSSATLPPQAPSFLLRLQPLPHPFPKANKRPI
ncbi:hypothetical protein BDV96DRAFT_655046 [Lophiotrema nucula]|uniref:Uncharacterized protein n=1 Tax=Lophiotrema nucula TaxID=690887 RepID=A0A6A5YFG7_9PLEO|nr:hypothetical protein BDV96DRAFT_655046 [Lophiotrema nucula]